MLAFPMRTQALPMDPFHGEHHEHCEDNQEIALTSTENLLSLLMMDTATITLKPLTNVYFLTMASGMKLLKRQRKESLLIQILKLSTLKAHTTLMVA